MTFSTKVDEDSMKNRCGFREEKAHLQESWLSTKGREVDDVHL